MPHLNLNFQVLVYEDACEKTPLVRLPDLTKHIQGVGIQFDKSDRIVINPAEIKDIAVTTRNVQWDTTTELEFVRPAPGDDKIRIQWTGVGAAPIFRAKRSIGGGADTEVAITRVSPYVARISVVSGTAWNTAAVQAGDWLKFEQSTASMQSPFSTVNLGTQWQVQAKGSDYIDFVDNGQIYMDSGVTLGADFAEVLKVLNAGAVKARDTVEIASGAANPSNTGRYQIVEVSDNYIEILNPYGVEETVLYTQGGLTVFEYLIGFVLARGSGPFKVRFGNQSEWALIDRVGDTALLLSSLSTFKIEATNDGPDPVEISIQHCKVVP